MISKQHRGCDSTRASIHRSYKEFDSWYCLKTALKADEGDMEVIAVGSVLRTSCAFAGLSIDKVVTVVYKITLTPLDHGKGEHGLMKLNRISHVHV
jgi:hypothetical protein